mgnify:CR=1 FL=1
MKISKKWLSQYMDLSDMSIEEIADKITSAGLEVEGIEKMSQGSNLVIGKVISCEDHPDSDHLHVCQVDLGDKIEQIVCGAPNVTAGQKVIVARVGAKLLGGDIKAGVIRGQESNGMICSLLELGVDPHQLSEESKNGIEVLDEDAPVGNENPLGYLALDDEILDVGLTPNRNDCMAAWSMALETGAILHKEVNIPYVEGASNVGEASRLIVRSETEKCPLFLGKVINSVTIKPSPKWMQRRLSSVGIRPINNLVDITNYVMEEYGQPMHAYDLSTIAENEIVVKTAKAGEKFVTLDGQEREMDESVLMICDGEKSVGIAGIMGGENSMITDDVQNVLFEAACFDGTNIRLSSKRIGLRTDASGKFEKGLDPNNAQAAIDRACQLMEELGAGEVVGGMVDICNEVREPSRVPFKPEKINALLGTDLTPEEMLAYLAKVELTYDEKTNEIVAPTFRQDIHYVADVAEEVARFFGYDKIPTTLPTGEATTGKLPFKLRIEAVARDIAEYCGFSEGMTYSFESPKVFDKLRLPADSKLRQGIVISNPLGEDYSVMRTTTLNGMLSSLATNYNRRNKDVRLYELGNVYRPKALPLTELPDERMHFTLGMYGNGDFFDMKGVCEEFFEKVGMRDKVDYDPNSGKTYLHPGRQANMVYDGKVVGYLGEVHPLVADTYGIGDKAYVAVIDILTVLEFASFNHKYTGIAKYPAVTRDLSMVVPKTVLAGQIEHILTQRGGKILESYQLFDIYEGNQIKGGYKSMAYSLVFRHHDKTLEESEITAAMKKILNGLTDLGIELRS